MTPCDTYTKRLECHYAPALADVLRALADVFRALAVLDMHDEPLLPARLRPAS